jgi:hypothetical protein
MPNDSRSRRDKKEKEKKRKDRKDPKPLLKELPAEEAEATSMDVDGIHQRTLWQSLFLFWVPSQAAKRWKNLSLPLPLCPLQPKGKTRQRRREATLSQEDSEDGGTLSDDSEEVTPISSLLSPSQYVGTLMKPSGSRDKLFATAATVSPAKLDSTSLPLAHFVVQGGMEKDSVI